MGINWDMLCCGLAEISVGKVDRGEKAVATKLFNILSEGVFEKVECTLHDKYGRVTEETETTIEWGTDKPAFFILTDNIKLGNIQKVVNYIKAKKLGTVVVSKRAVNPGTKNTLKAWIWNVNWKATKAWVEKQAKAA